MRVLTAPMTDQSMINSLFLAGGITDCPDWQSYMVKELAKTDLVIYNPRRENFPIGNPDAAHQQIEWEFNALAKADAISFWFPHETLCPIVLYELGRWLNSKKPVFVGCDPQYKRVQDVKIQTYLARPDVKVVDSLDSLIATIYAEVGQHEDQ